MYGPGERGTRDPAAAAQERKAQKLRAVEKARRLAETRQVPPKVVRPAAAPEAPAAAAFKVGWCKLNLFNSCVRSA